MSANRKGRHSSHCARTLRQWLLDTFGDGEFVRCWLQRPGCAGLLTHGTLTLERWPVAGRDGGRYARGNIIPACYSCNQHEAREWDLAHPGVKPVKRSPAQLEARRRQKRRRRARGCRNP